MKVASLSPPPHTRAGAAPTGPVPTCQPRDVFEPQNRAVSRAGVTPQNRNLGIPPCCDKICDAVREPSTTKLETKTTRLGPIERKHAGAKFSLVDVGACSCYRLGSRRLCSHAHLPNAVIAVCEMYCKNIAVQRYLPPMLCNITANSRPGRFC